MSLKKVKNCQLSLIKVTTRLLGFGCCQSTSQQCCHVTLHQVSRLPIVSPRKKNFLIEGSLFRDNFIKAMPLRLRRMDQATNCAVQRCPKDTQNFQIAQSFADRNSFCLLQYSLKHIKFTKTKCGRYILLRCFIWHWYCTLCILPPNGQTFHV